MTLEFHGNPKEYVTIHLSHNEEREEHLVPKRILSKSPQLKRQIEASHDNTIEIQGLAAETFNDLVHFLNGDNFHLDEKNLKPLRDAAIELGLSAAFKEREKDLISLWMRTHPKS